MATKRKPGRRSFPRRRYNHFAYRTRAFAMQMWGWSIVLLLMWGFIPEHVANFVSLVTPWTAPEVESVLADPDLHAATMGVFIGVPVAFLAWKILSFVVWYVVFAPVGKILSMIFWPFDTASRRLKSLEKKRNRRRDDIWDALGDFDELQETILSEKEAQGLDTCSADCDTFYGRNTKREERRKKRRARRDNKLMRVSTNEHLLERVQEQHDVGVQGFREIAEACEAIWKSRTGKKRGKTRTQELFVSIIEHYCRVSMLMLDGELDARRRPDIAKITKENLEDRETKGTRAWIEARENLRRLVCMGGGTNSHALARLIAIEEHGNVPHDATVVSDEEYEGRNLRYGDLKPTNPGDPNCDHAGAVMWNPFNKVTQCHRCGETISDLISDCQHPRLKEDTIDGMSAGRSCVACGAQEDAFVVNGSAVFGLVDSAIENGVYVANPNKRHKYFTVPADPGTPCHATIRAPIRPNASDTTPKHPGNLCDLP